MMAQDYGQPSVPRHGAGTEKMATSQQPIGDAVTTAFDKSDVHDLDPKLIAQITENVIKQLRQVNLQATPAQSQATAPALETQTASPKPNTSFAPPSRSPQPITDSTQPVQPEATARKPQSTQPEKHTEYARMESPEVNSTNLNPEDGRPKGPVRLSTSLEETPLERIWGPLFDEQGVPTPRLGQLLRGLAVHLVEDYEPKNSLVVTPAKIVKYYRESKLEKEYYPWHIIFDDEDTYVSRMYRELGCEHHLVQDNPFERPEVPGLTPLGFSKWMTMMLLAHPEEEFERLRLSVVNMPISNPNDRRERFPKDISKRLFPSQSDPKARNDLRRAICRHSRNAKIDPPDDGGGPEGSGLKNSLGHNGTSGARHARSVDAHGSRSENGDSMPIPPIERERQPYRASTGQPASSVPPVERIPTVGPAGESAIADDDHTVPPMPIERERKPYYATPGGGKNHEESPGQTIHPASTSTGLGVNHGSQSGSPGSTASAPYYPPPPRQSSVGPPPAMPGLARSNSNRSNGGRMPVGGQPINGSGERGPPPAPSAGAAGNGSQPPEIHQPPPSQNRSRNGSFTRRRAPSGSRTYVGSESRPIVDDGRAAYTAFQPGSYDGHKSVYVERSGGHDGYGTYEEEYPRRSRGSSFGQPMGGYGGVNGTSFGGSDGIAPGTGREGIERRRSPPRRDVYRETGRY